VTLRSVNQIDSDGFEDESRAIGDTAPAGAMRDRNAAPCYPGKTDTGQPGSIIAITIGVQPATKRSVRERGRPPSPISR